MITGFRHKGLKRLYEEDSVRLLPPEFIERLRGILAALDAAQDVRDMDRPSLRLHSLKGNLKGFWAVTVRANWRVIFRFQDGNAFDVDFIDYH